MFDFFQGLHLFCNLPGCWWRACCDASFWTIRCRVGGRRCILQVLGYFCDSNRIFKRRLLLLFRSLPGTGSSSAQERHGHSKPFDIILCQFIAVLVFLKIFARLLATQTSVGLWYAESVQNCPDLQHKKMAQRANVLNTVVQYRITLVYVLSSSLIWIIELFYLWQGGTRKRPRTAKFGEQWSRQISYETELQTIISAIPGWRTEISGWAMFNVFDQENKKARQAHVLLFFGLQTALNISPRRCERQRKRNSMQKSGNSWSPIPTFWTFWCPADSITEQQDESKLCDVSPRFPLSRP